MENSILLIGVGRMGLEYARILKDTGIQFIPIGRGLESAQNFMEKTGVHVKTGGIENYLDNTSDKPETAIITVNVPDLYFHCRNILLKGFKRILLEKPGALTIEEVDDLRKIALEKKADVFVAYNRRYLESVREARKIISNDGGVLSFQFEFTEWSDRVEVFEADPREKEFWFLSNSSHFT
jgi:predicted dehydrogenase